jgi:hypothetical protein
MLKLASYAVLRCFSGASGAASSTLRPIFPFLVLSSLLPAVICALCFILLWSFIALVLSRGRETGEVRAGVNVGDIDEGQLAELGAFDQEKCPRPTCVRPLRLTLFLSAPGDLHQGVNRERRPHWFVYIRLSKN